MLQSATAVIKKYGNRRLYDTHASRYITLEQLAEKVRRGADVRVVDARNGEDLTQATLTQLIVESRGADRLLPVTLLHQLIRLGDDALAEFLGLYLSGALELYLQTRKSVKAFAPFNPFARLPLATNPFARLFSFASQGWAEPPQAPPSARSSEVDQLRREVAALKKVVHRRPSAK